MAVGDFLYKDDKVIAVIVEDNDNDVVIALIDQNHLPKVGFDIDGRTVTSTVELKDYVDAEEQYYSILTYNSNLREKTTTLQGPVAGLHWFHDRLYAVASVARVSISGHAYNINDIYDGDAVVLAVEPDHIYIGDLLGLENAAPSTIASLYQSRSEQQAHDELDDAQQYGWEFIHQGWSVPFEQGISLYGSLNALNLNRTDVEANSPTNTDAGNGRPLSVTQNVEIAGLPTQVNGWKKSETPLSYNIDEKPIGYLDDSFLYADAFIAWDAEGVLPQLTSALESRSANATVPVFIEEDGP